MEKFRLSNVLFIDIECVPQCSSFYDLETDVQKIWEKKASYMTKADDSMTAGELYENRSWIYAEYGKIIVISVGRFVKDEEWRKALSIQSFSWDDEKKILTDFFELLNNEYDKSFHKLSGHNIKEFDVPYICRRATVHGLILPNIIDVVGKKPREINFLDTMDLWKFWDRKSFVSLDLLCRVMDIQTPKDDISGEEVARVYRQDNDLQRIQAYCEKDVIATAKLLLKMVRRYHEMPDTILMSS